MCLRKDKTSWSRILMVWVELCSVCPSNICKSQNSITFFLLDTGEVIHALVKSFATQAVSVEARILSIYPPPLPSPSAFLWL
jgi:hypothetical protein